MLAQVALGQQQKMQAQEIASWQRTWHAFNEKNDVCAQCFFILDDFVYFVVFQEMHICAYHIPSRQYKILATSPLNDTFFFHQAVRVGSKIFVFGGNIGTASNKSQSDMLIFDMQANCAVTIVKLPVFVRAVEFFMCHRFDPVCKQDTLVLAYGIEMKQIWEYRIADNTIHVLAELGTIKPRCSAACAYDPVRDMLFTLGGYPESESFVQYRFATSKFIEEEIGFSVSYFAGGMAGRDHFAAVGFARPNDQLTTFVYEIVKGEWYRFPIGTIMIQDKALTITPQQFCFSTLGKHRDNIVVLFEQGLLFLHMPHQIHAVQTKLNELRMNKSFCDILVY